LFYLFLLVFFIFFVFACLGYYYVFILGKYNQEGMQKFSRKKKECGYDLYSVQSTASKLSCRRTALKRCTIIEILWYRKLVSLASLEFGESSFQSHEEDGELMC